MKKRLKKKLINFSPAWQSWWRRNRKRDLREARFVTTPFYCSNIVTESMNSFYVKKKYSQVFNKKFRSKKRAVRYSIASGETYTYIELLSTWSENWQTSAKSGNYLKYRYDYKRN